MRVTSHAAQDRWACVVLHVDGPAQAQVDIHGMDDAFLEEVISVRLDISDRDWGGTSAVRQVHLPHANRRGSESYSSTHQVQLS